MQYWQAEAGPDDLNKEWPTSGPAYFTDLEDRINAMSGPDCVSPYDEACELAASQNGTFDDAFDDTPLKKI